jgi:hypothetical protein
MCSEPIREQHGIANIVEDIGECRRQWTAHVERTEDNSLPKKAIKYRPRGRRLVGKLERW